MIPFEFLGQDAMRVMLWALLGFAWWYFFFLERPLQVDSFRQRLFEIRGDLFTAARNEQFVDRHAHQLTRTMLNGAIRFAHELSLSRILTVYFTERWLVKGRMEDSRQYYAALGQSIKELSPSAQKHVTGAIGAFHMALLQHVIRTSVILAPLYYLLFTMIKQMSIVMRLLRSFAAPQPGWAPVDVAAYVIGRSDR